MRAKLIAALAAALIVGGLGFWGGWRAHRPAAPVVEKAAAAVRQSDGSLELQRQAATPAAQVQPGHELPKGATLERQIALTIQPQQSAAAVETPAPAAPQFTLSAEAAKNLAMQCTPLTAMGALGQAKGACGPVRVDLSLIKMPDQTRRVVASSPDGEVVGGLDIPVSSPPAIRDRRWSVGALVGWDWRRSRRVYGGEVSRRWGRIELGGGQLGDVSFGRADWRF